ncbi:MAG: CoB--CoM heterodisulfide reductase iron-sulfur subunit B family protein [bacterium]|jgi:heterodisulfide reductase subunit B
MSENRASAYRFFPGCLARTKLPHIEVSVRRVLESLGIGLEDDARFTCCPDPVVFRSSSRSDWLSLAARNLSLDGEKPIVTLCPGCASSLSEARHLLSEDPGSRTDAAARIGKLGLDLNLPPVSHFLEILFDEERMKEIAAGVKRRLDGLRIACHYGCHLTRPSGAVDFDDPEKPRCLDELVALVGAESITYEDKYLCCGRPSLDEETSTGILERKLSAMKEAGAQAIVLACPFCFEQFDVGQTLLERKTGRKYGLPVFYLSQLLCLAMGGTASELGLDMHKVKAGGIAGVE